MPLLEVGLDEAAHAATRWAPSTVWKQSEIFICRRIMRRARLWPRPCPCGAEAAVHSGPRPVAGWPPRFRQALPLAKGDGAAGNQAEIPGTTAGLVQQALQAGRPPVGFLLEFHNLLQVGQEMGIAKGMGPDPRLARPVGCEAVVHGHTGIVRPDLAASAQPVQGEVGVADHVPPGRALG